MFREYGNDSVRLQVVFERSAVFFHPPIQRFFAGVAKRRMPEVVAEGDCLREIFIETECTSDITTDLRDFHGVGKTRTYMIKRSRDKDLRFSLQAAKSLRVDDAVAVTLEGESRFILGFLVYASKNALMRDGKGSQ